VQIDGQSHIVAFDKPLAKAAASAYLGRMLHALDFCLPTKSTTVPASPDWLHEVKYDGYRLEVADGPLAALCGCRVARRSDARELED
jgi:hypothetical protein